MHACAHSPPHLHIPTHTHTHKLRSAPSQTHTRMHTHTHACTHTRMHARTHACTDAELTRKSIIGIKDGDTPLLPQLITVSVRALQVLLTACALLILNTFIWKLGNIARSIRHTQRMCTCVAPCTVWVVDTYFPLGFILFLNLYMQSVTTTQCPGLISVHS